MSKKRSKNQDNDKYIALSSCGKKYEVKNVFEEDVTINRKDVKLRIKSSNGLNFIVFKNKKFQVDIIERDQNKYEIAVNGVCYPFTIESPFSYKRKKFLQKSKKESKIEQVIAPMPGKIIEVLVENNAEINKGESVIILEAMKMQNEITSPVTGTIKSIYVKKDENVMKDDLILEIEK